MKMIDMHVEYLGATDEKGLKEILKGVAIASRISRTNMNTMELKNFVEEKEYQDNVNFIRKVMGYGHTAITELQYIVLGIQNVSIILEHYLIGKRMTAFTIKSRRECNFQNEGIYIPTFHDKNGNVHDNNEVLQQSYLKNAENLFSVYRTLVNADIPYQDARAILPYSFASNEVMALTVHEACIIVNDLLYGPISQIEEARKLGEEMKAILLQVAPYTDVSVLNDEEMVQKFHTLYQRKDIIIKDFVYQKMQDYELELAALLLKFQTNKKQYSFLEVHHFIEDLNQFLEDLVSREEDLETKKIYKKILSQVSEISAYLFISVKERMQLSTDSLAFLDELVEENPKRKNREIKLLNFTYQGDRVAILSEMMRRYQMSYEEASKAIDVMKMKDANIERKIIQGLMNSPHNRSLEQVHYQFSFPCTLALTTHYQRQRLHSLNFPDFFPIHDLGDYDIPDSILEVEPLKEMFISAVTENIQMYEQFQKEGVLDSDLVYFYISGNVLQFVTSMNARYLIHLSRLRTCKKTQTLTRLIMESMCDEARKVTPLIGECLGPNCKVLGYCSEGNDNCHKKEVARESLTLKKK